MGVSVLPAGTLGLPELQHISMALFLDERKENPARGVFIRYLKTELESRVR